MLKRFILSVISIMYISTGVVAQNQSPSTPEHLKYYFVFRQLSSLNQKAVMSERNGEDGFRYRQHYKKFALLNDQQMSQLDQIAYECLRDVAVLDARIHLLVSEARARILAGKLEPRTQLSEPQATELKQLDAERDKIIRRAYTQLIDAFGETEFRRFNEVIDKSMQVNTIQVVVRAERPRQISILPDHGVVYGITSIQKIDGNVLLYTATSLDAITYSYYDGAIEGSIYDAGTGNIISIDSQSGGPLIELMLTASALPNTDYAGIGKHFLTAIIPHPNGWADPLCFSININPVEYVAEKTFYGCGCNCPGYVVGPVIYLGFTYDDTATQSGQ